MNDETINNILQHPNAIPIIALLTVLVGMWAFLLIIRSLSSGSEAANLREMIKLFGGTLKSMDRVLSSFQATMLELKGMISDIRVELIGRMLQHDEFAAERNTKILEAMAEVSDGMVELKTHMQKVEEKLDEINNKDDQLKNI